MQTFNKSLNRMLKRTGLHGRLKSSWIHDVYWMISDKKALEIRQVQVEFYRALLDGFERGDLIFDIGANEGAKTDVFLRLGAKVVAVEPDEVNQEVLRNRFLDYRLGRNSVVIVGKAVSDKRSVETMWIDGPGSALNTLSQKWVSALRTGEKQLAHSLGTFQFAQRKDVETTTLEDLTTLYGHPLFVKIDVEGHEFPVLRGLRRAVPYLSFEVNLPEFRSEGLRCVRLLAGLDGEGEFNYACDCKRGLLLDAWFDAEDFVRVLSKCAEESIEVFWRTRRPAGGGRVS